MNSGNNQPDASTTPGVDRYRAAYPSSGTVAPLLRHLMLAALALITPLSACSRDLPDVAGANIAGYNHTTAYIHQFYVNGARGPNVYPYEGGGKFACCITYPRHWTPELKAKVRWTTSDADPNGSPEETWHEAIVPIERYQETGNTLDVHFLADGSVRVLVTSMSADHPDYPGPAAPEKPADYSL